MSEFRKHLIRNKHPVRNGALIVGAGLVVGAGWGVAVESHTDEVARGKIVTAEYCLGGAAVKGTIDSAVLDCLQGGVPGGNPIDKKVFKVGDSADVIKTYIAGQENEAAHIEPGRIVAWSAAPFGAAAVAAFYGFI